MGGGVGLELAMSQGRKSTGVRKNTDVKSIVETAITITNANQTKIIPWQGANAEMRPLYYVRKEHRCTPSEYAASSCV
jgi:hypothetical protein